MTGIITSHDVLDWIHADSQKPEKENWLRTGIRSLDDYLCSHDESHPKPLYGGEMIIVSGDEKEGKTTLARSITDNMAAEDKRALWFSYEETAKQFVRKFGSRTPLFFMPDELAGSSVGWIADRIRKTKAVLAPSGERLHAVFIDHLHYLVDLEGKHNNITVEIGGVCRQLKRLALAEDVVLFLIVHTNRSEGQDEPTVRSLRDSGMIGKEADAVLFVWRYEEGDQDNLAMVKVAVARGSGVKNKKAKLIKDGPFLKQNFS
jgi:replicative DNA helicase